jgi:Txe/YoeB family toxin of Txe-Axe toxin-antitoxin module
MSDCTMNHTRTRWPGDEGFDRMEYARHLGWKAIPNWGRDGWDLGSWPLVVVYHRGELEIAVDVEGDIDIEKFATREERDRKTDEIAFFCWKNDEEEWVKGIDSHEQMAPELRGAFSRRRLNDERRQDGDAATP